MAQNTPSKFLKDSGTEVFNGNELLVKGALETDGGVHLLTGYPGSPVATFFDVLADCADLLKEHGIDISMSRKANPWDNAACESFMKTLKYEEVHRNEYRNLAEARAAIHEFLEKVYNRKRLHSALGYLPPVEFERNLATLNNKEAASRQLSL